MMTQIALGTLLLITTVAAASCGELGSMQPTISPAGNSPSKAPSPATGSLQVASRYLEAWASARYGEMYALLSVEAKASISEERFSGRYRAIGEGAGITAVVPTTDALQARPREGAATNSAVQVPFIVTMRAFTLGEFTERNVMSLVLEDGEWRVNWSPSLIFQDLTADGVVRLLPDQPARASILDRKGRPLAEQGKLLSIGVVPGEVTNEGKVLSVLAGYLGLPEALIKARYANAQPDWWVPLRDLPLAKLGEAKTKLGALDGVALREKEARVYPNDSLAAHTIGYVSPVGADDLKELASKGYEEGDFVGRTGIEAWAEETLAGVKGGQLVLYDVDGSTLRTVAKREARAGQDVYLTIDLELQRKAEGILGDKTGSLVIMDARDNSILALVSHPSFDPNAFVTGLSDAAWQKLSGDPRRPFQNRPLLSVYPTGSIFKVVTMAAGLESGGFRPESQFLSNGRWQLPGTNQVFRDWVPQGHGQEGLVDGLAQSCNIVFYEIGYKLDSLDPGILPRYARSFGLGEPTGIVGLPEAAGTLPDPEWKRRTQGEAWYPGDGVNLAIGQGYFEATPLQMANLYAALANGGTLRSPLLVKRVGDGVGAKELASQERRKLPVSAANLGVIREGMKRAAASSNGTAYYAFRGFTVPTAAKTGSAENQNPESHAWFAGYAPADAPQVVVLAMVEGGRAGGEVAAPLGRQLLEAYFAKQ